MGVVLALAAAVAYGLSDFVGGIASRRTTPWPVALLSTVGGFVGGLVLAFLSPGDPATADFGWAVLAGIGSGAGMAFLYRGLATGKMGVVGPVSAVGAALLPVLAGVAIGERPPALVWAGIAVAFPGIWLVAREPATGAEHATASGLADGLLAGVGFGLLFLGLGQVEEAAGHWPLAVTQGTGMVVVTLLALAYREQVLPRAASDAWGLASGALGTLALLAFTLATQSGLLTVSAVLTSLYPAFTVLLAVAFLRERVHAAQAAGLLLCGVAVALVAGG